MSDKIMRRRLRANRAALDRPDDAIFGEGEAMMLGKLLCALPKWLGGGHKRGKLELARCLEDGLTEKVYVCWRCGATWTRKVKRREAK